MRRTMTPSSGPVPFTTYFTPSWEQEAAIAARMAEARNTNFFISVNFYKNTNYHSIDNEIAP